MNEIAIRPILKTDIPKLAAIDHSSSTDHVWQLELRRDPRGPQVSATFREVRLPRPVRLQYPHDPASLIDEWKNKALVCVAARHAEPVGYLSLTELRGGLPWITDLVVAPRWRRQGIAGLLIGEALKWADERGLRRLFFEMQSKNYPSIMLAQKHGFEFCGYNDRYYSSQDIALVFVRGI